VELGAERRNFDSHLINTAPKKKWGSSAASHMMSPTVFEVGPFQKKKRFIIPLTIVISYKTFQVSRNIVIGAMFTSF